MATRPAMAARAMSTDRSMASTSMARTCRLSGTECDRDDDRDRRRRRRRQWRRGWHASATAGAGGDGDSGDGGNGGEAAAKAARQQWRGAATAAGYGDGTLYGIDLAAPRSRSVRDERDRDDVGRRRRRRRRQWRRGRQRFGEAGNWRNGGSTAAMVTPPLRTGGDGGDAARPAMAARAMATEALRHRPRWRGRCRLSGTNVIATMSGPAGPAAMPMAARAALRSATAGDGGDGDTRRRRQWWRRCC